MKTTIIFLGLVALSFTNANATTVFETQFLDQQESATVIVESTIKQNQLILVEETSNNTGEINEADKAVFSPNTVVKSYAKTIEDVVAEDKLITEGKEVGYQPLTLGYTFEDRIAEENQIIEGTISNEVFPLDFNKIDRPAKINNNAIVTSDLKL